MTKRLFRTRLAMIFSTVVALSPGDMKASEIDNPGFGKCAEGSKHAVVPSVLNLSYNLARKKILAAGWRPRVTVREGGEVYLVGQDKLFWDRGYKEVRSCSQGRAYCAFFFEDDSGVRLEVYSRGEEWKFPDHRSYATVYTTRLYCPVK